MNAQHGESIHIEYLSYFDEKTILKLMSSYYAFNIDNVQYIVYNKPISFKCDKKKLIEKTDKIDPNINDVKVSPCLTQETFIYHNY
ncbi:hypothetical protein A3Q56_06247 [Intoshia linei]|uniref:Uncharacterized protein n=1 Tax=Intoshia linei TaxID=1819745 RepID=A0A177AXW4_9BILA|nr:hypothetical protein A3Q56_06247 [Intoshia linei]